ncbi:glycosyltransferase family 2 protein, partial [Enterobacter hormaechei subsp. xiangfangensis]
FDIYSNHRSCLTDQQLQLVKQRVKAMYTLSFFLSTDVRFSYKKRVIEALWKK